MNQSAKCAKLENIIETIKKNNKANMLESEGTPTNLSHLLNGRGTRQKKTYKIPN